MRTARWHSMSFDEIYSRYRERYASQEVSKESFVWADHVPSSDMHEELISWACWCQDIHSVIPSVEFYGIDGETYQITVKDLLQVTDQFDRALKRFADRPMDDISKNPMAMMTHFKASVLRASFQYALRRTDLCDDVRHDAAEVIDFYKLQLVEEPQDVFFELEDSDGLYESEEEEDAPEHMVYQEKIYVRGRWYQSEYKSGWYYLCRNKKTCDGSIFLDVHGIVTIVSVHSEECQQTEFSVDFDDCEFLLSLRRHLTNSGKPQSHAILDFIESYPEFSENFNKYDVDSLLHLYKEPNRPATSNPMIYGRDGDLIRMDVIFDSQHIIVISSDEMLQSSQSVDWIMFDGTFKCVPKKFYQLMTILGRCIETQRFVPIIHFLLPGKTERCYRAMFELLDTRVRFICVNRVTSDFEKGLQNQIQLWMSRNQMEASFQGCRFHFAQALHRRMKRLYGRAIETDLFKKRLLRLMSWFPFLEREVVENLIVELQRRKTGIEQFVRYFVTYWMPKFDEWTITELNPIRTTNNPIESYHSILGEKLGLHPTMKRFLHNLAIVDQERLADTRKKDQPRRDDLPIAEEIIFQFQTVLDRLPVRQ